ncbi:MAG: NADPH-dependent F420 reductase [Terriglobia bacterium]
MTNQKIAVIGGTGDLGFGLALRWARAGVPVVIGSRDEKKAQDAAQRAKNLLSSGILPGLASSVSDIPIGGFENAAAAARAQVVVLAVPFPAQVAILKSIRGSLQNAILVDTTVPLAATVGGKPTRLVGVWQGSAAEQASEIVPANVPVLAAFHNLSAEALQDLSAALDCDILVCGDDEPAKQTLFPLIQLIDGLRAVDAGPLEMARITEAMTALLISVNRRYRVHHSGIRITGISEPRP